MKPKSIIDSSQSKYPIEGYEREVTHDHIQAEGSKTHNTAVCYQIHLDNKMHIKQLSTYNAYLKYDREMKCN